MLVPESASSALEAGQAIAERQFSMLRATALASVRLATWKLPSCSIESTQPKKYAGTSYPNCGVGESQTSYPLVPQTP